MPAPQPQPYLPRCGPADYLAIFHTVFLPLAIEFQPGLVIVSAGYDAAIGCPEGEMLVRPPHLHGTGWYIP